jgi:putative ATPase
MRQQSVFNNYSTHANIPLAEKARPQSVTAMQGQHHLLQPGSPLRNMLDTNTFHSFVLWGPPGTGKTTIAQLIAKQTAPHFHSFSAVLSKIADVKELMHQARLRYQQEGRSSIVFVDEIHRFNKAQQDAFLPYVESGAIILIGATTENPSFEVIPALLSRCHVFVLKPLNETELLQILNNSLLHIPKRLTFADDALQLLAEMGGGDGRKALNNLELVIQHAEPGDHVTRDLIAQTVSKRQPFYDKRGEEHYNLISALQKSIRGSDAQAALYWLARLLEAGEDPLYVTRRLARIASEDIGLADPQAIVQAAAVKELVNFLGMPEANTALSQLTVYLATAPKSNSLESAYLKAAQDALRTSHLQVPLAIRNAPTKLMKDQGYGRNYHYSHEYSNHYHYQRYFPEEMKETDYYEPGQFGFEKEIKKRMDWWQNLKSKQVANKEQKDE